jgi:hypothetical protein
MRRTGHSGKGWWSPLPAGPSCHVGVVAAVRGIRAEPGRHDGEHDGACQAGLDLNQLAAGDHVEPLGGNQQQTGDHRGAGNILGVSPAQWPRLRWWARRLSGVPRSSAPGTPLNRCRFWASSRGGSGIAAALPSPLLRSALALASRRGHNRGSSNSCCADHDARVGLRWAVRHRTRRRGACLADRCRWGSDGDRNAD